MKQRIEQLMTHAAQLGLPRREAEILVAEAAGVPRSVVRAFPERTLPAQACARARQLLDRRSRGEPVAYLLGRREFWSLDFVVDANTLIPRPETETLVETALALATGTAAEAGAGAGAAVGAGIESARRSGEQAGTADAVRETPPVQVLDLGTGSGAVALAIAGERPAWSVTATDIDADTLSVAQHNAARLGRTRVVFRRSDWWHALAGTRFHLVVSNPPYVAAGDAHLHAGDVRFEPRRALVAGTDGLDALRIVVAGAPEHLFPGGWLAVEHGQEQGAAVRGLFAAAGFEEIFTACDLAGAERVTAGRRESVTTASRAPAKVPMTQPRDRGRDGA